MAAAHDRSRSIQPVSWLIEPLGEGFYHQPVMLMLMLMLMGWTQVELELNYKLPRKPPRNALSALPPLVMEHQR